MAGPRPIDGIDVRDVAAEEPAHAGGARAPGAVPVPDAIADNIAYGRPDASRPEIEAAARAANAHEFIARLPDGYDTVVGERGATLSGGERQRLSIARALLKDAPILILDEPTSALDAETEALLLEALERLMQGRTTLIIAHRLSHDRQAPTASSCSMTAGSSSRARTASCSRWRRLRALPRDPVRLPAVIRGAG